MIDNLITIIIVVWIVICSCIIIIALIVGEINYRKLWKQYIEMVKEDGRKLILQDDEFTIERKRIIREWFSKNGRDFDSEINGKQN